jgi:hypothetical protein
VNFASIFGLGIEKENAVGNGTGPEWPWIAYVVLLLCISPIPWQPDSPVLASPVSSKADGNKQPASCSLSLQQWFQGAAAG